MKETIHSEINEQEVLDLSSEFIVLSVPSASVEVTISAKVWKDGKIIEVKKVMPFDEVRAAMKEAEDGYIPSDAIFTLAPTSAEKLEELLNKYRDKLDED